MKFKMIALTLALSLVSWAQTATPSPSTDQPAQSSASAGCSDCCKHMADDKDAKGCCHDMHAKADSKQGSCCGGQDGKGCMGKDAKSCMKDDSADASCTGGKCCDMKDAKGCCSHSADGEKTAMACCSGAQCGKDHAHSGMGMGMNN